MSVNSHLDINFADRITLKSYLLYMSCHIYLKGPKNYTLQIWQQKFSGRGDENYSPNINLLN